MLKNKGEAVKSHHLDTLCVASVNNTLNAYYIYNMLPYVS